MVPAVEPDESFVVKASDQKLKKRTTQAQKAPLSSSEPLGAIPRGFCAWNNSFQLSGWKAVKGEKGIRAGEKLTESTMAYGESDNKVRAQPTTLAAFRLPASHLFQDH
ncbi:hypothetical protein E5288_WYG004888 [Bos mutus]|uniref:Uncharacterized protein n=1 Tax=Bos mutus TaxID=72004 RepID=A0A6B0QZ01_9CETA|nr:hypothetical protein [Bos mutus]